MSLYYKLGQEKTNEVKQISSQTLFTQATHTVELR